MYERKYFILFYVRRTGESPQASKIPRRPSSTIGATWVLVSWTATSRTKRRQSSTQRGKLWSDASKSGPWNPPGLLFKTFGPYSTCFDNLQDSWNINSPFVQYDMNWRETQKFRDNNFTFLYWQRWVNSSIWFLSKSRQRIQRKNSTEELPTMEQYSTTGAPCLLVPKNTRRRASQGSRYFMAMVPEEGKKRDLKRNQDSRRGGKRRWIRMEWGKGILIWI